eukprot:g5642.t1
MDRHVVPAPLWPQPFVNFTPDYAGKQQLTASVESALLRSETHTSSQEVGSYPVGDMVSQGSLHRELSFPSSASSEARNEANENNRTKCNKRRGQGYRKLWQQVTHVTAGQKFLGDCTSSLSDLTVEDLLQIISALPATESCLSIASRGLSSLDSSACAALLKELCRQGLSKRAFEIFDWLRTLHESHELASLCDVYTFTTMVAQCGSHQQLRRALELVADMRSRGIKCNVRTFTALMNVCIKANEMDLALDVHKQMIGEGCVPNLVTYNTLIDIFGKTGEWKRAIEILDTIDLQGIQAEVRTYNTVISACSRSGEPDQALNVYQRMLAKNMKPSATTYTALISAYGKKGLIDEAIAIFHDMVRRGCERNVITYSSLIGACEKSGRWELAIELFQKMYMDGCKPNVVTFNSLIAACANSSQWSKACEVYGCMIQNSCRPDSTTYTTLFGVLMKGGSWTAALTILEDMNERGCRPDNLIYNALLDILWQSGNKLAQSKCLNLWKSTLHRGIFKFNMLRLNGIEYSIVVFTCGAAIVSLLMWLQELKRFMIDDTAGTSGELTLVMQRGKHTLIEHSCSAVRDAVATVLYGMKSPFTVYEVDQTVKVTAIIGDGLRQWFSSSEFTQVMTSIDNMELASRPQTAAVLAQDSIISKRCFEAFASVKAYEDSHKVMYGQVSSELLKYRTCVVQRALDYASKFGFNTDAALDAVWLFNRLVTCGKITVGLEQLELVVCVCVLTTGLTSEVTSPVHDAVSISTISGFCTQDLMQTESLIREVLDNDLSGVSPMRIINLFAERLNGLTPFSMTHETEKNLFRSEIIKIAGNQSFVQFSATILASSVFYVVRKAHGMFPFWPTELSLLTGYSPLQMEELTNCISMVENLLLHREEKFNEQAESSKGTDTDSYDDPVSDDRMVAILTTLFADEKDSTWNA